MPRFPDGARVCFIGDSITHNNVFLLHIVQYYRSHFPDAKVEFYNCGISGGTLGTTLACFDEDVAPFAPTHAVLMIGINDSARTNLNKEGTPRYDALRAAFDNYKTNLSLLCKRLKDMGVALTLCTPGPYAEYIPGPEAPLRGGSALMLGYSEYVKAFAKEQGYPLCDYHSTITRLLSQGSEELYQPDRVHPNNQGYYRMAECFLAFQGLKLEDAAIEDSLMEWHKAVGKLRNVIATEHFILHDDFTTTDQQRMAAIEAFAQSPEAGPHQAYFTSLARSYPENKKRQKELLAFVTDFMKQ